MTEAEKLAYIRSAEFSKKVQRALTPKQSPSDVFNVAEANLDLAHEAYFTAKTDGAPKNVLAPLLAVLEQARFVCWSAEFLLSQAG